MKKSEIAEMEKRGNTGWLYQIAIPVEKLSTLFMLWCSFDRPCKILVNPSQKNEEIAVVEFRHDILAAQALELIRDAQVVIVKDQPNKLTKL